MPLFIEVAGFTSTISMASELNFIKGAPMIRSLAIIALFAVPCVAQEFGALHGLVLDDKGQPLPQAIVYALPENDMRHQIRTSTDADGKFLLQAVPPGIVYLSAYKESAWYPYDFFSFFMADAKKPPFTVVIAAGQTTEGMVLSLGPRAARLNLKLIGPDGTPVKEGASLSFDRDDMPGPYGTGLAAGESLLVPPVPFRLTVTAKGYEPWRSGVIALKSGEILDLAVTLRRSSVSPLP